MTVNSKGAAVLSEDMHTDWNCLHVCCDEPGGSDTGAGDGTPPPVIAVEVDTGTSTADEPGGAPPTLKVSGAFPSPGDSPAHRQT